MSDGTLNFPKRASDPSPPSVDRYKIWVDSNGKPRITDENGDTIGFENIYGSDYSGDKKNTEETNNTTSFVEYLSIPYEISDTTASAQYEITLSIVWNYSSGANDYRGVIKINGVIYGQEFRQEPKDGGADQRFFTSFPVLVGGDEIGALTGNISWDFASSVGGNTARTYYCSLTIKRVK